MSARQIVQRPPDWPAAISKSRQLQSFLIVAALCVYTRFTPDFTNLPFLCLA